MNTAVYLPLRYTDGDVSIPDVVKLRLKAIVVYEVSSAGGARQFEQRFPAPTSEISRQQLEGFLLIVFVTLLNYHRCAHFKLSVTHNKLVP